MNTKIFNEVLDLAKKLNENKKTMTYEELAVHINKTCIDSNSNEYSKTDPLILSVCDTIKKCFVNKNGEPL